MKKLKLTSDRIDKVEYIIHISDVHIRNFKRHDEYVSVFNRVYEYCKKEVSKKKNTIIYLAGDIVHAKTDMSPELIVMTRNFFVSLGEIAPVILIAGNHDMNLNNRNRLDALSPIVESIDIPDFFYLTKTGIYTFGGIDFVLNAVYDDPENFILSKDLDSKNKKVVLFHGSVDSAKTDAGIKMKNGRLTIRLFEGFDFGMFGDIHSFQYLDSKSKFAYAGSLIQQNFGEGMEHGLVHWTVKTGKSKFIPIQNDWAFYTVEIYNGKFLDLPDSFSPNSRVRIRSFDTKNSELLKAISKLKSKVNIEDIRIQKFNTNNLTSPYSQSLNMDDVRDVEFQNELIRNYLNENYVVDKSVMDEVEKINRALNVRMNVSPVLRNVVWNPIKFEFDNMFSYGEDNHIDFSEMNGTYGIFAPNASGKSSIFDAIMFCLFDKCSRSYKASQVMNNKKDNFRCKFEFEISGKHYFVERNAKKDKKGHVKVDVDFWYDDGGSKVSLNGDDRDGTNQSIRNYVGTYDDFIITALSVQNNNTNFIDKPQRDRKELLAQFLDLNLFEELNEMATDEIKSVQTLIREFSKTDYPTEMSSAERMYNESVSQLNLLSSYKESLQTKIEKQTNKMFKLQGKRKQIDSSVEKTNLVDLNKKKDELLSKISFSNEEVKNLQKELTSYKLNLEELQSIINKINYNSLLNIKSEYDNDSKIHSQLRHELENVKLNISHNQSKIDNLNTHEYDPNCKYCVNNVFVKDAKDAEKLIVELLSDAKNLESKIKTLEKKIIMYPDFNSDLKLYSDTERKISDIEKKILGIERRISEHNSNEQTLNSKLDKTDELIGKYIENEETIKFNQNIDIEIEVIREQKTKDADELRKVESEYFSVNGEIKLYEKKIKDCVESMNNLQRLEKEFNAYNFYLKAVNRNGVPYKLISDVMPKIQHEVTSILSQVVEFELQFETDGKSINVYIKYDDEKFWPLEMASGMEKFISSLAIRTALINISSLPRPNFICIDEGWGSLDSENLNSLHMFFDYMKTNFEFVLTISHIDALRDIMDSIIEIKKENGFSSVKR